MPGPPPPPTAADAVTGRTELAADWSVAGAPEGPAAAEAEPEPLRAEEVVLFLKKGRETGKFSKKKKEKEEAEDDRC